MKSQTIAGFLTNFLFTGLPLPYRAFPMLPILWTFNPSHSFYIPLASFLSSLMSYQKHGNLFKIHTTARGFIELTYIGLLYYESQLI